MDEKRQLRIRYRGNRSTIGLLLLVLLLGLLFAGCDQGSSDGVVPKPDLPKQLKTPGARSTRPKIIALGDSLTAGFGLTEKESFPFLLQQLIDKDGLDFEVVNAGVSGDTSLGGLERADWVLGQDNAKVLILELGANDLLRAVPVEEMRKNLDAIIVKAKAKGMEVLLCGMLAPNTMGETYQREFVKVFPQLADKHGVAFMPFILDGVALDKELNQPDGIHPNAKGEVIMTANVYKELKPILVKLTKASSKG
ncbi:MAG: arylesterase [Pyrinomonadaceae bacterium]